MSDVITMGSLFDGVGAVPLAASYFGIETLWASEILPNAISVTKRHFPDMRHLGDITKLDGGKIPPVQVIAFGSPCQSFSVAGDRSSFEGKSGLFFEAIRIIREMRSATNGKYPEIALFENVFGLLSVDSRRGYRTVLEAFTQVEIPMPASGRWANSGMVRGNGIDLAWIIKDAAQHYRVPQRRRRLFLVADFAGQRAAQILFIPQSLSRYFTARESERERVAANAKSCTGNAGGRVATFMAGQSRNARSIAYSEHLSPTMKGSPSGLNQIPCVCEPRIARTLTARGDSSPCVDRGQNFVVSFAQNQRNEVRDLGGLAACLAAEPGMKQQTYIMQNGSETCSRISGNCGFSTGLSPAADFDAKVDIGAVAPIPISDKATRYKGEGATRKDGGSGNGLGIGKSGDPAPTITSSCCHAVAVDCRNLNEGSNSGTLHSKGTGGYSLNYQNPKRIWYVVRRLTPLETERLMSLPDGWTQYGHDGKLMSDTARYSMCGNSIVVNCLAYIMQNIASVLRDGGERV